MEQPVYAAAKLRTWLRIAGLLALGGYAAALALATRPVMLIDDAAITFRYAERIAAGKGFTYNDHEHVLGASNPLYTLVLASCAWAGMDIETAARGLGVVLFALSVVLAALIAARLSSLPGGLAAGLLLASHPFFRDLSLNGMESGLAVFLGLLVVLALSFDWQALAALFLGLALWNKLDAAMLALAVAAAWITVRRRLPLKIAVISTLVAVPWFSFALWYFGSPLPRSMMVKLANNTGLPADHLWVLREILTPESGFVPLLVLGSALALPPVWRTMAVGQRLAAATLAGWFLLHGLAFSLLWLGDYYHWYLAVLCPVPIILGCAGGFRLLRRAPAAGWSWGLKAAGVAAMLLLAAVAPVSTTFKQLGANSASNFQVFDFDRAMAGLFLAQYASPSEVVGSKFGWVAYEIANPFNDYSGLNSVKLRLPNDYWVMHGQPPFEGFSRPAAPRGYVPLATFNLLSDLVPGSSWFEVFGRPDSVAARSGERFVELRLFELPAPEPEPLGSGLPAASIAGNDLQETPPSGVTFTIDNVRQPVRVVFAPAVGANAGGDATFELGVNGGVVYQAQIQAGSRPQIMVLLLPGSENLDQLKLSFVTRPSAEGGQPLGGVQWRDVKIIVGDAYVDLARLGANPLVRNWIRHNGAPPSSDTP